MIPAPHRSAFSLAAALACCGPAWAATINVPADQPTIQDGINAAVAGDEVVVAADTGIGPAPIVDMGAFEQVPGVRYVDPSAGGDDTGLTWDDAFTDLQDALAAAAAEGGADITELWVAAATYKPDQGTGDRTRSFALQSGLTILGGFLGNETLAEQRDWLLHPTTLGGAINAAGTADNSYHVVTADGVDNTAILDGFIIQKGNANSALTPNRRGGGVYVIGGAVPVISNCWIRLNEAVSTGAGAHVIDSYPSFVNCRFNRNVAGGSGGAVYVIGADSFAEFVNCVMHGNDVPLNFPGTAVYFAQSGGSVVNCTFYGNNLGSAAIWNANGNIKITNTILWQNGGIQQFNQLGGTPPLTIDYCTVQGWTGTLGGVDNDACDPKFVDPDGADNVAGSGDDDFRLTRNSLAIDSGASTALPAGVDTDYDGLDRLRDDTGTPDTGEGGPPVVDRGAYEFNDVSCRSDINRDTTVNVGDLLELLGAWGGGCGCCAEDVNLDEAVDVSDLLQMLGEWGLDC